ncbi:toll/interleukin-1 receptor domain-containing protein [Lentzea sp. NPDC059081]|uniref:toll/interleukin-1 receptor domain-containing protein n=1 Tax=Lentzea sp. NPDC059081 TaxID=3346719 RepID=UPI00367D0757
MGQVFISYRRSDAGTIAGRLHSTLRAEFGADMVFLDTSSVEPGAVWPDRLKESITEAGVVLVVIGPN